MRALLGARLARGSPPGPSASSATEPACAPAAHPFPTIGLAGAAGSSACRLGLRSARACGPDPAESRFAPGSGPWPLPSRGCAIEGAPRRAIRASGRKGRRRRSRSDGGTRRKIPGACGGSFRRKRCRPPGSTRWPEGTGARGSPAGRPLRVTVTAHLLGQPTLLRGARTRCRTGRGRAARRTSCRSPGWPPRPYASLWGWRRLGPTRAPWGS